MQFSLFCHKLAAVLSSELLKLSVLADLPTCEGASQDAGTFLPSQLPPSGVGPTPFLFHPIQLREDLSCIFGRLEIFCPSSVGFLRIFPCIGVFFYVFVGGGELYIFYSAILIPPCDYEKVVSIIYLYLIFTFLYSFISFWKNSCLLFKKTLSHSSALFIPLFTQS